MMEHGAPLITTRGRPITEREIRRGLRTNIVAGAIGTAWFAMTQAMPLTMFMEALGSSGFMMGLITSIPQFVILIQIPAALLAENLRARKPVWAPIIIISRAMWFLPILFVHLFHDKPALIAESMIWLAGISWLIGRTADPMWYSWMADLVPKHIRGRFWGTRQGWTMASWLMGMWLAGYLLDAFPSPQSPGGSWTGFMLVFAIGSIAAVTDITIHLWVPEPKPQAKTKDENWLKQIISPLKHRDFANLAIGMSVYAFAIGLACLGQVYMKQSFHATYSQLAVINIISALSMVIFSFVWGYVMDRIGARAFNAIMVACAPLVMIVWFFVEDYQTNLPDLVQGIWGIGPAVEALMSMLPDTGRLWIENLVIPQSIWLISAANIFGGALFGGIGLAQVSSVSEFLPEKNRTLAMAVYWSFVTIVGAFGCLLAGVVMDYFAIHPLNIILPTGTKMGFHQVLMLGLMGLLWFVVFPILLRINKPKGEPSIRMAAAQLFTAHPVSAVANIHFMTAAVSRKRRARAILSLGVRRARIAVPDLVQRLDDPSCEVREAAAFALGSIASPEAVDALLERFEDPNCDLSPQIARAFRLSEAAGSHRVVEALLARIDDPDRETCTECARSLGAIGDECAIAPLVDLMEHSTDMKVVVTASEALARLGYVKAVPIIARRMRDAPTQLLKRSLAVDAGDLLGEHDGLYKILSVEQSTRGVGMEKALNLLRQRITRLAGKKHRTRAVELIDKTIRIQTMYEQPDYPACARLLFETALEMVAIGFGETPGSDMRAFADRISERNVSLGMTIWLLHWLCTDRPQRGRGAPDQIDILLGTSALSVEHLWPE